MTKEERAEKQMELVRKQKKICSDEQFWEYLQFRQKQIFGLDCCDLNKSIWNLVRNIPKGECEELRDLLTKACEALADEQLRIADETFTEFVELQKARDELKELKKKKKKAKR